MTGRNLIRSTGRFGVREVMVNSYLVETPAGAVLVGAPLDAFKRLFAQTKSHQAEMPYALVVPDKPWYGGAVLWAPEFFVFYHIFVRQNPRIEKLRILAPEPMMPLVIRSLNESILGPTLEDMLSWKRNGRPAISRATAQLLYDISQYLAIKQKDGSIAPIEKFIDFIPFKHGEKIEILPKVKMIAHGNGEYSFKRGRSEAVVALSSRKRPRPLFKVGCQRKCKPLSLGCAILGNRSGFSTIGPNTGFLLWLNKHPVLLDGPFGTFESLKQIGLGKDQIEAVILSHVHEDHIGTLADVARLPHKPLFITTEPIYQSAITKLALYFGTTRQKAAEMLNYFPIHPGKKYNLFGTSVEFFYTAHPIPTIGLKADWRNQRLVISGDTANFELLELMYRDGIIPKQMYLNLRGLAPTRKRRDAIYFIDVGRAIIHGFDSDWATNPNRIVFYHTDSVSENIPPNQSLAILGEVYSPREGKR